MRSFILFVLFFAAVASAIASLQFGAAGQGKQNSSEKSGDFSHDEWAVIKTLSPLPGLPDDPTNKYRDSAAAAFQRPP